LAQSAQSQLPKTRVPYFRRRAHVTTTGILAMVLGGVIGFAAFNTGTNLLYLMFATVASFWVATGFLCTVNLSRIEIARRLPQEIYADQWFEIQYELLNRKKYAASYGVGVHEVIGGIEPRAATAYFLSLIPGRRTYRPARVRFRRRGWFQLQRVNLVSGFPFGFIEFKRGIDLHLPVLVYPKLIDVESILQRRAVDAGSQEAPTKGPGVNLYSIRNYVSGDSARSIHWKLSSKGTGIKVRETEREETKRVRVLLNHQIPAKPSVEDLELFERSVSAAASLSAYFLELGYEVGLWTPEAYLVPDSGSRQRTRIMETLATVSVMAFEPEAKSSVIPTAESAADIWVTNQPEGALPESSPRPGRGASNRFLIDPAVIGNGHRAGAAEPEL